MRHERLPGVGGPFYLRQAAVTQASLVSEPETLTRDAWRVILMASRAAVRWRSPGRGWTIAPTCGYAVALRCLMFRLVAPVEPSGKANSLARSMSFRWDRVRPV